MPESKQLEYILEGHRTVSYTIAQNSAKSLNQSRTVRSSFRMNEEKSRIVSNND